MRTHVSRGSDTRSHRLSRSGSGSTDSPGFGLLAQTLPLRRNDCRDLRAVFPHVISSDFLDAAVAELSSAVGDSQNLAASFTQQSQPMMIPSSFLSLHYTGIVSDNMFFTAAFSKSRQ